MLIGVSGKKRSGKDEIAKVVAERGFRPIAYADPIRRALEILNPVVHYILKMDGLVELRYNDAVEALGYEAAKEEFPEIRRLMQVFGTDVCRVMFGDEVWTNYLRDAINRDGGDYVVTDIRFRNEARLVQTRGGVVLRVVRPGLPNDDTHDSETSLNDWECDYIIQNDGTLDDLRNEVNRILDKIL